MTPSELITLAVPTSPIRSHPSTAMIEESLESVRKQLPDVRIVIQVDGLREENANRREQYEEYRVRLRDKYRNDSNIIIYEAAGYRHQAELQRETFPFFTTPLLLYWESDWRLLDEPTDWQGICDAILSGDVHLVRLYRWDEIVECHQHLMHGELETQGIRVVKTTQWSGHPSLMSTDYMKRIINQFRVGCRTLIEEFIYGPVATNPWDVYRCSIYKPEGSMKRIFHMDGRCDDEKFPAEF